MFRNVLTIVAVAALVATLPAVVVSAQDKPTAAPSRTAAKPAPTITVNINTAPASEFEGLPGIGAKTAARIVEYRQKNGPFKKIEEILETSRSCPYSLSVFDLGSRPSVSRSR
jgi:competence ComEA-like helix-hairpin-helix protein